MGKAALPKPGLSASALKYLACLSMLIDHVGYLLFPQLAWLRLLGRLAFPIFAFMIANGYRHTSSPGKYLLRLILLAALCQWPYSRILHTDGLNILFTLALGLAAIWLADMLDRRLKAVVLRYGAQIAVVAVAAAAAQLIHADYGWYGVAIIFTAWLFFEKFPLLTVSWTLLTVIVANVSLPLRQLAAVIALLPLFFYNGQRGKSPRWFFYVFYPAHLLLLYGVKLLFF